MNHLLASTDWLGRHGIEPRTGGAQARGVDAAAFGAERSRMLKRDDDGRLFWGPGHLTTWSNGPYDMLLWADMARSYLDAALELFDRIDARCRAPATDSAKKVCDPQDLVLPFVSIARQGVELLLKTLILCRCHIENDAGLFAKGHDLSALWANAKEVLAGLPGTDVYEATLDALVGELMSLDKKGEWCRYPADINMCRLSELLAGDRFFVGGVLAVPTLNLSLLAESIRSVRQLVFAADIVEEWSLCRCTPNWKSPMEARNPSTK